MKSHHCCILSLICLLGCGASDQNRISDQSSLADEFQDAPGWVMSDRCLEPWVSEPDQKLCGVGSHTVSSRRNLGMARKSAKAKGRAAIANTLAAAVGTMLKDYSQEWVEAGLEDEVVAVEQRTSDVTREISKMTLHGAVMVESWISPNDTLYVLMVIEHEKAIAALKTNDALSEHQKDTIDTHAEELFDELDGSP